MIINSIMRAYTLIGAAAKVLFVGAFVYDGTLDYLLPYMGFPTTEQINSRIAGDPIVIAGSVRHIDYDIRRNQACRDIKVQREAGRVGADLTNQKYQIDWTEQSFGKGPPNFVHSPGYDGLFPKNMKNGTYRISSHLTYLCNFLDQVIDRSDDMDKKSNVIVHLVCGVVDNVPEDNYKECPQEGIIKNNYILNYGDSMLDGGIISGNSNGGPQ